MQSAPADVNARVNSLPGAYFAVDRKPGCTIIWQSLVDELHSIENAGDI
jgi:hypothetical protein